MKQSSYGLKKLALAACMLVGSLAAHASPSQFVGKMYTEALGRAPEASGFTPYVNVIANGGCNSTSMAAVAKAFLPVVNITVCSMTTMKKS